MEYQMKRVDVSDFKDLVISEINGIEKPVLKKENRYIVLSDFQKKNIVETLRYLFQSGNNDMQKDAKDIFNGILTSKNRGKIYEVLTYSFFRELSIPFVTHFDALENSSLKKSGVYVGDGKLTFGYLDETYNEAFDVLLEIKSLGIGEPMLLKLKEALSKRLPDYYILVEGNLDVSTKDMQTCALEKIDYISSELMKNKNSYGELIYSLPKMNINIRAIPYDKFISERIIVSDDSSFYPYKWAKDNEMYFIRHCSQVCNTNPFLIVCPFDECVSGIFTSGMTEIVSTAFRSLARRMFIGLNRCSRKLNELDGKADNNVKISDVIKMISGIVFLNVNKSHINNGKSIWIYVNPNAQNPIPRYQLDRLVNYSVILDDFMFDNY